MTDKPQAAPQPNNLSWRAIVTFLISIRDRLNTQDAIDSLRPDFRTGQLNLINALLNDMVKFDNVRFEISDLITEDPKPESK
jgi:hypothetical protein